MKTSLFTFLVIVTFGRLICADEANNVQIEKSLKVSNTIYSSGPESIECVSQADIKETAVPSKCVYLNWKDDSHSGKIFVRQVVSLKPNAETIIFINGGPGIGHQALLSSTLLKLRENYNLIWYDQRGTASSYIPISETLNTDVVGIKQYSSDLIAIKRMFSNKPVHLYGHSFGGLLAQTTSKIYPDDIKSLILVSPIYGTNGFAVSIHAGISTINSLEAEVAKMSQLSPEERLALIEKVTKYLKDNNSLKAPLYDYPQFPVTEDRRQVEELVPPAAILDCLLIAFRTYFNGLPFSKLSQFIDKAFTDGNALRGYMKTLRSMSLNGLTNHSMLCSLYPSFVKEGKLNTKELSDFESYCKALLAKFETDSEMANIIAQKITIPAFVITAKSDDLRYDSILLKKDNPSVKFLELEKCTHEMLATDLRCIPDNQILEFLLNKDETKNERIIDDSGRGKIKEIENKNVLIETKTNTTAASK
jgi:pimeloyl-ACP methyl ester carboxylesterase